MATTETTDTGTQLSPAARIAKTLALCPPEEVPCELITTTARAVDLIMSLKQWDELALDTETDSVSPAARARKFDARTAYLRTIQIAAARESALGLVEQAWIIDVRDVDRLALAAAFDEAGATTEEGQLRFDGWNANFDDTVLGFNLRMNRTDPVNVTVDAHKFAPVCLWTDLMYFEGALRLGMVGNTWYASLAEVSKKRLGIRIEGKGSVQLSYDPTSDLTEEQCRYGAVDAVVTRRVGAVLRAEVEAADLIDSTLVVCGARPVMNGMRVFGLPFDPHGWMSDFVSKADDEALRVANRLAELTGGGQADLFSGGQLTPSWNPKSDVDVKRILNTFDSARVEAFFGEPLGPDHSVDKGTLKLLGGELAQLIAEFRVWTKVQSTYGDGMMQLVEADGRMHAEYTQCLTDTGRASSRNPNAQNFHPKMKLYFRPVPREILDSEGAVTGYVPRAFVCGDFSQAELRVLAQLTGERVMREAFEAGIDQHEATAAAMFKVNMEFLRQLFKPSTKPEDAEAAHQRYAKLFAEDSFHAEIGVESGGPDPSGGRQAVMEWAEKTYDGYRQRAKPLNFGIPYGMREGLLADTLTLGGIATSREEGKDLLDKYYSAMESNAAWLEARDATVVKMAEGFLIRSRGLHTTAVPECDFRSSWRLHQLSANITKARNELRGRGIRKPDAAEITAQMVPMHALTEELTAKLKREPSEAEVEAEFATRVQKVEWAMSFVGSAVLCADGTPFAWESRTIGNRRRLFQISTEAWMASMAMSAATSRNPRPKQVRSEFAAAKGFSFPATRKAITKLFGNRQLRLEFLSHVIAAMPEEASKLMYSAMADCVRGAANEFRNAPIQGSVADAVERCFAPLNARLRREFPTAHVIQSVHDSVVLECDLGDAEAVSRLLKEEMEAALAFYCPDVKVKADVDIQATLDAKKHKVSPAEVPVLQAMFDQTLATTGQAVPVKNLLERLHTQEQLKAAA